MFYIHGGEFEHGSGNEFPGHQLAYGGQVVSENMNEYHLICNFIVDDMSLLKINHNFSTNISGGRNFQLPTWCSWVSFYGRSTFPG